MEKRISKGVLSAALVLVTSFVCGIYYSRELSQSKQDVEKDCDCSG